MNIMLAFLATFATIFFLPILIYGLFSKFFGIAEPEKKPRFFLSVVVQKIGTAIGFVWLYAYLEPGSWLFYAFIWWLMFAVVEVGQAIMPNYSKKEALAGVISEALYFPLAAWIISVIL